MQIDTGLIKGRDEENMPAHISDASTPWQTPVPEGMPGLEPSQDKRQGPTASTATASKPTAKTANQGSAPSPACRHPTGREARGLSHLGLCQPQTTNMQRGEHADEDQKQRGRSTETKLNLCTSK